MWISFPKEHAYELHDYVVKKEYMRAYLKMKGCYRILHDMAPNKFTESDLELVLNDLNDAIDNYLFKDDEFKMFYNYFINWCDTVNVILPAKLF